MSNNLIIFYDFETTGLNYFHDEIIEYAFLTENGEILTTNPFNLLNNNGQKNNSNHRDRPGKTKQRKNLWLNSSRILLRFSPRTKNYLNTINISFLAHNNERFWQILS